MNYALSRFVVQSLAAFLMLTGHCEKKRYYRLYAALMFFVLCICAVYIDRHMNCGSVVFFVTNIIMFAAYLPLYDIPVKEYFFYYLAAMLIQDSMFNMYLVFYNGLHMQENSAISWGCYLVVFVIVYYLAYVIIIKKWLKRHGEHFIQNSRVGLSFLVFAINMINPLFVSFDPEYSWANLQIRIYNILASVLAFAIQFGVFRTNELEEENIIALKILENERRQHEITKETTELIHHKCHDLKQQIAAIRQMTNQENQEKELKNIEEAVSIYGNVVKTGNEAMNLILMDKNIICEKEKIRLASIVDGNAMGFINDIDVYTLFGNALDNAIESVRKEKEQSKRFIVLNIVTKADLLVTHMENSCSENIEFKNGIPISTKGDSDYHGYGVSSMKFIVDKYHGSMSMKQEDDQFILDIIMPLP